jgi:hypothetical protein
MPHGLCEQAQLEGDPFTRVAVDVLRGSVKVTVELVRTPVLEDEVTPRPKPV